MRKLKMTILSAAIALGGLFAAPVQAAEQMDSGLWVDVYYFDNGRSSRMAVFFHAANDNGKLAICGAYYLYGGASMHRAMLRHLNRYRIYYQGRALTTGHNFMTRARSEADIPNSFSCRTTDLPFTPNANDQLSGNIPGSG